MTARAHEAAVTRDITMAEFEAAAQRLGRVVITNGNDFAYAAPGQIPAGWREFRMVDRSLSSFKHAPDDIQ